MAKKGKTKTKVKVKTKTKTKKKSTGNSILPQITLKKINTKSVKPIVMGALLFSGAVALVVLALLGVFDSLIDYVVKQFRHKKPPPPPPHNHNGGQPPDSSPSDENGIDDSHPPPSDEAGVIY